MIDRVLSRRRHPAAFGRLLAGAVVAMGVAGASAQTLKINECYYLGADELTEWIEFFVTGGGNLDLFEFWTQDGEIKYNFPNLAVVANEFVVLHVGIGVDDLVGPTYHLYWGKSGAMLANAGDDLTLLLSGACHDYVAYDNGTSVDPPPIGCGWTGTGPTATTGYSISMGPDGVDGDTATAWEVSGALGGPATYGPSTQGVSNMYDPTPARLRGAWSAAGPDGVDVWWETETEIATAAFRVLRRRSGSDEPVSPWLVGVPGSFVRRQYAIRDSGGRRDDTYLVEEVDASGEHRLLGPAAWEVREGPGAVGPVVSRRPRDPPAVHVPLPVSPCRLEVEGPGWLRLAVEDLAVGCPQVLRWDALRVTRRGREVARSWRDGVLEIEVPAPSSRYERGEVYVLWPQEGREPATGDAGPRAGVVDHATLVQTHRFEEDSIYFIASPDEDRFFWAPVATDAPWVVSLDPPAGALVELRVRVVGVTEGPHRLVVRSGVTVLGEIEYAGRDSVELALSDVSAADRPLTLELTAEAAGTFDFQYLDWIEVDVEQGLASGPRAIAVPAGARNLVVDAASVEAAVWDVTTEDAPVRLEGVERRVEGAGARLRVGCGGGGPGRLRVVDDRRPALPFVAQPLVSLAWPRPSDYVAIADPRLGAALEPLLRLRRAQGLRATVVDARAVRDALGDGYGEPAAIRAFLAEAARRWGGPPRYLLLAGQATLDPQDNLGTGTENDVPSELRSGGTYGYEMPVDDDLVPPDMRDRVAIGRLAARTPDEVAVWAEKLVSREAGWTGEALVLADGTDPSLFDPIARGLAVDWLAAAGMSAEVLVLSGEDPVASVLERLGVGPDLLVYVGHGAPGSWGPHLRSEAVGALPEVTWRLGVSLDCYDGLFANPFEPALAWKLVAAPGRGALGVYAPSTVLAPAEHVEVARVLFPRLAAAGAGTVGEAILAAEAELRARGGSAPDIAAAFNLLGDPAMPWGPLSLASPPLTPGDVATDPEGPDVGRADAGVGARPAMPPRGGSADDFAPGMAGGGCTCAAAGGAASAGWAAWLCLALALASARRARSAGGRIRPARGGAARNDRVLSARSLRFGVDASP